MNLMRIDHVSLNTNDRPATIAWYRDVLGLVVPRPHDQLEEPVFLGPDGARLGLFGDRAPGLRHVALATDVAGQAEVVARLQRLGIPFLPERHADHDSVYVRDPDGSTVEVMVPLP